MCNWRLECKEVPRLHRFDGPMHRFSDTIRQPFVMQQRGGGASPGLRGPRLLSSDGHITIFLKPRTGGGWLPRHIRRRGGGSGVRRQAFQKPLRAVAVKNAALSCGNRVSALEGSQEAAVRHMLTPPAPPTSCPHPPPFPASIRILLLSPRPPPSTRGGSALPPR